MVSAGLKSLLYRHATMLIIIPVLATALTLATGFLPAHSPSPAYGQAFGSPIPWKTDLPLACTRLLASNSTSHSIPIISPCPASFEANINPVYLAADVFIYALIGYAFIPLLLRPRTIGVLVVVTVGILVTALTSIPAFHEEIGTGYPITYDKHGFPLPWLTFVTGGVVCGPGFDCPIGPIAEFNWVSLTFDTILYVAIASATLFILWPRFFNTPAQPVSGTLKTRNF